MDGQRTIFQLQYNRKYRNRMLESECLSSKIQLLGYFTHKLNENSHFKTQSADVVNDSLRQTSLQHKENTFTPIQIIVQTNCIAVIDKQNKGWLITDFLAEPICLSELLRVKIYGMALGYNQLIVNVRDGCLLISWGNKRPIKDTHLTQIPVKNSRHRYSHLFEVFKISETHKNDRFYFSTLKKAADKKSLFRVSHDAPSKIKIYPDMEIQQLKEKIVGLTVGKYHKMCWDEKGRLYSWGCKSLALGHQTLPEEQYIGTPQLVYRLKGFVLKAYAGVNYSLAITLEGKLYEWGIRKISSKGEQLVFEPRQIMIQGNQKLIDLKGRGQRYGALTLSGGLFLWGKNMEQNFKKGQDILSQSDSTVNRPKYFSHPDGQIIDFSISESVVGLVISSKSCVNLSECQSTYWKNLKNKVGVNLRHCSGRIVTECSQQKQNNASLLRESKSLRRYNDPIELAWYNKLSKNNYIEASSREDQVVNFIVKPTEKSTYRIRHNTERSLGHCETKSILKKSKWASKRQETDVDEILGECQKRKDNFKAIQSAFYTIQNKQKEKLYRAAKENKSKVQIKYIISKPLEKNYEQKLQSVLQKKKQLELSYIEKNVKMLENTSFEFRMRCRIEKQELKKKSKQVQCCRSTIQEALIKQYLVKLIAKTVAEGRQLKIGNFANSLRLKRLQNNIRGVFVKNRIKLKIKQLAKNQLFRYSILKKVFRKYVKNFRQRKYQNRRKFVTQELFKSVIKQKIKVGLSAYIFNVRKLQKFREWVAMVKAERKRCLKYMWKVYLLSTIKINTNHENTTICNLPKNVEGLSVEVLYQEKLALNPLLKLANFLDKYSIFKIKATYFQRLVTLFTLDSKKIRETKIISSFQRTKKFRIKFYTEDEVQDRYNLMQNDILPYSLHYNQLIHPKNYDIMIPQIMKQNEKWIRQEKKEFERHIQLILKENTIMYRQKRRDYDIDLAVFIRRNYDSLSEKRWKYIIEYNKTQKTFDKQKKQKELRRLLSLVNAESKIDEDCLPEKHLVLQQALRRYDCPKIPNSSIIFTMSDFRRHFRPYFETLFSKVKEMRRSFF